MPAQSCFWQLSCKTHRMNLRILATLLTFSFLAMPLFSRAEPIAVGAKAPAIEVTNEMGETMDLAGIYADNTVLVYFYPKADTPGCTNQACNLRDSFAELEKAGITVLGASRDDVDAQRAFKEKYGLPFHLVADTEGKLADGFGVNRTLGLFTARQSFLVRDGIVVWRDTSATPATQAADALAAAKSTADGVSREG